tara:strand:- start:43 stop:231 length:189 start_codon:yes stop_codon:yes gene_type:complete
MGGRKQFWNQLGVLFDCIVVIAGNQNFVAMRLRFKPLSKRLKGFKATSAKAVTGVNKYISCW